MPMNWATPSSRRGLARLMALAAVLTVASCRQGVLPPLADDAEVRGASPGQAPAIIDAAPRRVEARTITIDGRFEDWSGLPAVGRGRSIYNESTILSLGRVWATFNDRWVYLRVELGRPVNVQGLTGTLTLQIDADGNPLTGDVRVAGEGESALGGVDFEVHFSPRRSDGGFGGVAAEVVEAGLPVVPANPYWFGASFAPTFAHSEIEMRLSRGVLIPGATVMPFVGSHFAARLVFSDETGSIIDRTGPFAIALAPMPPVHTVPEHTGAPRDAGPAAEGEPEPQAHLAAGEAEETDAAPQPEAAPPRAGRIARRDGRDVRAVSWNAFDGAIFTGGGAAERILRALDPDVVCFQELGADASAASLKAWLEEHVPSAYGWEAVVVPEHRVGVASRLSAVAARTPADDPSAERPLRAASLLVAAANRRVLVTSVHLKCCGRLGDASDQRRIEEAEALRRLLRAGQFDFSPSGLLIMGDLNLVGSHEPLDIIRFQNDLNATDLLVVEPMVLGDETNITWRNPALPFLPGRLDYVLISDAVLTVSQCFILDTEHLDRETLGGLGLEREDSRVSDHLPVVVDYR